jgi:hypothetical protein
MGDVVSAMLYLCSDEASFITCEAVKVSGGYPLDFWASAVSRSVTRNCIAR